MIKHKDHFHGSDLEKIEEIYGIKKEEIVSFSANVNPLGVSPLLKHTLSDQIDAITSYPDREYTSLAQMHRCILRNRDGERHCRKRLHRADLPFYSGRASEKGPCHWSYLL